ELLQPPKETSINVFVMSKVAQRQKALGRSGCGGQLLSVGERHDLVVVPVGNEDRPRTSLYFSQVVESIADHPARREPRKEFLGPVGNGRKSAEKDQRAMWDSGGEVDGHAASQGASIEQDSVGGDAPF